MATRHRSGMPRNYASATPAQRRTFRTARNASFRAGESLLRAVRRGISAVGRSLGSGPATGTSAT